MHGVTRHTSPIELYNSVWMWCGPSVCVFVWSMSTFIFLPVCVKDTDLRDRKEAVKKWCDKGVYRILIQVIIAIQFTQSRMQNISM